MNDISHSQTTNKILSAVSAEALDRLSPMLEPVELKLGELLFRPDEHIEYVYFPIDSMISVVANTVEGQSAEVAVVGCEGALGLAVILGAKSMPYASMVQREGRGLRIPAKSLLTEFERQSSLHRALLDFVQKYIVQISQTALCNRLHSIEQRLARWLLMCHDRAMSDKLSLTQEFLSIMLGANRTTVTMTAIELQKQGLISYTRGKILVTDRARLEQFTCSCYAVIKKAYESR